MEWKEAIKKAENTFEIPERWLFLHYYEALTILFRIENSLRVFVYTVLKNQFREKWSEQSIAGEDSDGGTIISIAKKRMSQAKTFGYLGYPISCPIMHLTSGELTRLITSEAYWKYFRNYFLGGKEIMRNKLEEIGNVRNSLAHFRPISKDDVELVKQDSKHVLSAIEKCISEMIGCADVVPTNTADDWYQELRTVGTDNCDLPFSQSRDEEWVRIDITYDSPILKRYYFGKTFIVYRVLNIASSAILKEYPGLSNIVTYLSESVPYTRMGEDFSPDFQKAIHLVFSRRILGEHYKEVKSQIEQLLSKISKETELITHDNLAKGDIVQAIGTTASLVEKGEESYWSIDTSGFVCQVREDDPPEFWGDFSLFTGDFISATHNYPWMPIPVSKVEYSL